MNKQTVIAALERLKDGTKGVVAATISDCQRVISAMDDDPGWISVTERMPDEHESLFARYKGTDKWFNGMFMTISDLVIICAEYENGERIVKTANTTEGIWKVKDSFYPCRVTHWIPLPNPKKEDRNGST